MTLSALIVDDEAPARKRLRDLLKTVPDVELLGECPDGPSAVEVILERRPDIVFLDIQMPEMSGFDVLRSVGPDGVPAVVFVTAYDRHALEAFDARALDYLLKPFTEARFNESLDRVRRVVGGGDAERDELRARLARLLEAGVGAVDRIPVRKGDKIRFVPVDDVIHIEASGNYVRLHTDDGEHLVRGSLKSLAERLEDRGFVRIHNSHVVNWACVEELETWGHGEYQVTLRGGARIVSSRTYGPQLRRMLDT